MSQTSRSGSTAAELEVMRRLRAVLKRSSSGLGLASAFVGVFSSSKRPAERLAVRKVLLGTPVEMALAVMIEADSASGELLRFIASLAAVSSREASRGAERLSSMFDRWTLLKEKRSMEKKVMAFRGTLVSAVAGVVVGMLSTLAPVISGCQITLGTAPQAPAGFSPYEGAVFLVPSAVCIGLFLSPERPYTNVVVSLAAFVAVVYFLGPLASFGLAP